MKLTIEIEMTSEEFTISSAGVELAQLIRDRVCDDLDQICLFPASVDSVSREIRLPAGSARPGRLVGRWKINPT